jgi:hypothetical protein
MKNPPLKVASYVRDMTLQTNKFVELDRMVREAKGKVEAVLIMAPEVLGDNYDELVDNLNELAAADLKLIIVSPTERTRKQPMN